MGRGRGFLCCFSRPPARPPPQPNINAAPLIIHESERDNIHQPPSEFSRGGGRGMDAASAAIEQQQQQIRSMVKQEVEEMEQRLDSLKGDLAKEMGYPLATRLIHEVTSVFDPNVDKVSLRNQPNPWGWLSRNYDFKRALHEQSDTLPVGMTSVEAISYKAAQIMAHSNKKFIKCYPEQLYTELKTFREKGYMEALKSTDADLHSFLDLAGFFATAFVAKPRLLQLATFMLQRVRDELAIYWHTWEKLPFSWNERWHEAESWFQAAVDCFKEQMSEGGAAAPLPGSIIELARDFDNVEEAARRTHGVSRIKEVGSFEQILRQFGEMKDSGLLTSEVRKQNALCYALLEHSTDIKTRYTAIIDKKRESQDHDHVQRRFSTSSSSNLISKQDSNSSSTNSHHAGSINVKSKLSSPAARPKSDHDRLSSTNGVASNTPVPATTSPRLHSVSRSFQEKKIGLLGNFQIPENII